MVITLLPRRLLGSVQCFVDNFRDCYEMVIFLSHTYQLDS